MADDATYFELWPGIHEPARTALVTQAEEELRGLLIASLGGSAVDYRRFLVRLGAHLRAYYKGKLVRSGQSDTEAEDLVQETLMVIHTRRHTYDVAQPVTPWIHAIARYKLIDHLRRTRSSTTDVPVEDAGVLVAHDDHVAVESSLDVERLLAHLPAKMRNAIRSTKVEGLSTAEAAERSGMTETAVKVSVHRGLKALTNLVAGKAR
ncbi:RNA polymerase sigma factor (sigma-70 family) [Methylobacterium sp. PvP062]|uniref:RNA polymerase sigma-70 factor (ECF subfamily) n=2 Tax=Methylobacterium TaxID=407 RepID=A0ABV2NCE8_9HYPH|nr:sigma-70 family RNA polymerase sigma factor [Methylobacterium brachiatum]MBP2492606.1 RNA polymerase sigma-70 factor (ECF subfamily) [Methylobacterium sp. PvP105]MBP2501022.1 RNA polymerase sigma-70 factor (ECF subfamily) [Methylobacterium sp. PvP109]MDQ0440552.1 RNA polymerase sigma-70 factor (ECF subfamily) [Methylobacterium persicinum]GJE36454.1 ECF RNA polymerase sigma factor SigF [Methylobacterium persicinum]